MINLKFTDLCYINFDLSEIAIEMLYEKLPIDIYDIFTSAENFKYSAYLSGTKWWRKNFMLMPTILRVHADTNLKDDEWYVIAGNFKITCEGA